MTQLATRNSNGAVDLPRQPHAATPMNFDQLVALAGMVAKSGMFKGVETPDKAMTLMLLCEAEGLHPIEALRQFDIIDGKPTLKAATLQAKFQARGGVIEILVSDEREARALFSHPTLQPKPKEFSVTWEKFEKAGIVYGRWNEKLNRRDLKDNWKNYPDAMLWWRLVSTAIRRIYPGISVGIYSTEEAEDMITLESPPVQTQIAVAHEQARTAIAAADEPVPGHDPRQPDTRPYALMSTEAVTATNELIAREWGDTPNPPEPMDARKLHGVLALKAVNQGLADGPAPTKVQAAVAFVSRVYAGHRHWVRCEVSAACQEAVQAAADALAAARAAVVPAEDVSQEDGLDPDADYPDEPGTNG